jgi:hypothetical protein
MVRKTEIRMNQVQREDTGVMSKLMMSLVAAALGCIFVFVAVSVAKASNDANELASVQNEFTVID